MKIQVITTIALLLFFTSGTFAQQAGLTKKSASSITWGKTIINVGVTPLNKAVTAEFTLTNNGEVPIFIKDAKKSCGCMTPIFDKKPIAPGKSSIIKVTYDSKKVGKFMKPIRVTTSDSDAPRVLYIKGEVK